MRLILKHFGKIIAERSLEDGREYFIGRQEDCDFALPEETGLSRKHVKIYQSEESGHWVAEIVSEWGGLYLDGEEIEAVELAQPASLNLKSYVLEFVKEGEKEEEREPASPGLSSSPENQTNSSFNDGTKIFSDSHLVYSLYIYIAGEFSDHIRLSEGDSWIIGRSEECDISLDYDILTRKHLQISKAGGQFYVKDLGSSNKTFLNGQALEEHKEILLRANDEISVSDLKIVFEVRNKNYEQIIKNLPVIPEDSQGSENPPEMAFPKVILESAPPEEAEKLSKKRGFLNKKALIALSLLIALGGGLYFKYESDKKIKQALLEQEKNKEKEREDQMEVFYKEAMDYLAKSKFQFCVDQISELHILSPVGYFKDSRQILLNCRNGLERQRQKEERMAQEKIKRETEERIKKIAEDCKKQFDEKKIQTEEGLNQCAEELLGGLDPANADISAIRMKIQEKASLKLMEEQKKAAFRTLIQKKKALYRRAKKIRDQNKPLKAVAAYNIFLKSARSVSSLKGLSRQAEEERDEIQKKYDDRLSALLESCESLIQAKKMREAYYDCKKALLFKSSDIKAQNFIQQALSALKKDLKPIYEKSVEEESFSRVEEAKKLWKQILEKDVEGGHYYKKAKAQLKKYK